MYDIKEFCTLPPPYGGVTTYVKRLIEKLNVDGFTVGGYYSKECNDDTVINSKLFDKWTWMQTGLFPIKIWKYLCETSPYRIVHSHFSLEGMIYLWFIKIFGKKRIIITVHNSMSSTYYESTNRINRFFLNRMLKSKDVTWITVSEQGKQQLLSFPVSPISDIHVIPAYVPIVNKGYEPLEKSMQYYIDSHTKNIAFYGHSFMLHGGIDIYGFKTVIKAYASVLSKLEIPVGLVLCLADSSDLDRIDSLYKYANTFNVNDKIFWQIGAIDNINTLWHEVDIYIRPTSTDGDSVAVREVLDEGAIVIASDVCKRPDGVFTYRFNDDLDLFNKILEAINSERRPLRPSFEFYNRMKSIYNEILNND